MISICRNLTLGLSVWVREIYEINRAIRNLRCNFELTNKAPNTVQELWRVVSSFALTVALKSGLRIRIHLIRIRIQHLGWIPIQIRIQSGSRVLGDDQKFKKIYCWKKNYFFKIKNYNLPFPRPSIKDVRVTKEAFGSQKRTSKTSKYEISKFFYFCGSFLPSWIWIRIHWPDWIRFLWPDWIRTQ